MGTENAMLAATLAEGHTVIRPAAQEPEVDDLIASSRQMGAAVERTEPDTIEIEGRKRLRGAEHRVVPDRIEAGTFIIAAAVTGGRITLEGAPCAHLGRIPRDGGPDRGGGRLRRRTPSRSTARRLGSSGYRACDIETAPYPGLATDLQPPTAVLLYAGDAASRRSTRRSSRTAWSG